MKKLELIRELLAFHDKMDEEIVIRLVNRDEHGVVISEQTVKIDNIGHFFTGPTTINFTKNNLSKEKKI